MRILNITAQKPDGTGSGVYLSEMVRAEKALGHQTAVVCGLAPGDGVDSLPVRTQVFDVRFDTPDLPFHVCGMSNVMPYPATRYCDLTPQMVTQFASAFRHAIQRALGRFRPDVIICHHLYLATALARACAPDLPMAAVCHSTDLRQMAQHGLERDRIVRAVRGLDAVLALHEAQASQIREVYGVRPGRIHVIGTGINDRVFSPGACQGEARVRGSICYAGKVWGAKGVPSLLRAADSIGPDRLPPGLDGISLDLAGGRGDDGREYQAIVDLAASIRWPARLLGRLSQEDLARVYARSEVFCLPSFFEGLPLVLVEALACGCKLVATDLPGVHPWLASKVEDPPVVWVRPPRMLGVDVPDPTDLPAFEDRLSQALVQAVRMEAGACDVSQVSWLGLTRQALSCLA